MPKVPGLRPARDRALLTQEELAVRAQVARSTIIELEAHGASARPTTIRKLARALGVTPSVLLEQS